jgi:hypothetical protein
MGRGKSGAQAAGGEGRSGFSFGSFFRRQILPDPRDAEYAAAVLDDGSIDPAWEEANTHNLGPGTSVLPNFPIITTPETLEFLRERGFSEHAIWIMEHDLPRSQGRYPLTYARLLATAPARKERERQERQEREEEDKVAQAAAEAARLQFRAEREHARATAAVL